MSGRQKNESVETRASLSSAVGSLGSQAAPGNSLVLTTILLLEVGR